MTLHDLNKKSIVILGAGREGRAMLDIVRTHCEAADVTLVDEKETEGAVLPNAIIDDVSPDTIVIKSPGIPWHRGVVIDMQKRGATFTSATNIFFAERKGKGLLIGITGTKGKSTTTSLLAHTLKLAGKPVVLAGNIGSPMILRVDEPDDTIFVLELSSYQLVDLERGPDIAVMLNVFPEHMDYHTTLAAYKEAKMRIATTQAEDDVFVYNAAFPELVELASRVRSQPIPFSLCDNPALDALTLKGEHNRENACAALTVLSRMNIDADIIREAFSTFTPLSHRLETVGVVGGVTYVNDSISTTPESAIAAVNVYRNTLGAILLGGHDRGYDFRKLAERLAHMSAVRIYVLPGGERVTTELLRVGLAPVAVATIAEAVNDASAHVPSGSVVLLSPASPSFGQFKNFEERGAAFCEAVKNALH